MIPKHPSLSEGPTGRFGAAFQRFERRRTAIALWLALALLAGFLVWTWFYLQPRTWRYYTDETNLRRQANRVQPQTVLWENANRLDLPFALAGTNAAKAAFSFDQQRLVFVQPGTKGALDLFIVRRKDNGWGPVRPLPALNSLFNETDPAFSRDGQYLYFATDRPGGPGGYDIWVARWDGETYAWPLPLTYTVNSKFNDVAPAMSGDRTLYFASDRPRDLKEEESKEPATALAARYPRRDFDIFYADAVPAGLTNVEPERAQSILYSLRERALASTSVMHLLGGSAASEAAVDRALAWLASAQETNGMWAIARHEGQGEHDVAATALALLAFYGRSERHDTPCRYQDNVRRGLQWLLAQQNPLTGDLRGARGKDMYDQCIGTLALAEAYGLTKDEGLRSAVQSAVFFLVDAQHPTKGGWRYQPLQEPDLSVSGWAVMALKSAEFSGIHVQRKTFDLVRIFMKSVSTGISGGAFAYQPKGEVGTKAMIATGFFCSQLLGLSPNSRQAFEAASLVGTNGCLGDVYFLYYGTLSGYQFQGPHWRGWRDRIHRELLASQAANGSWLLPGGHGRSGGRVVGTALVALSLQAQYRYTPLYGLGYEPPPQPVAGTTRTMDDLPEMPNYYPASRFYRVINSPDSDETDPAVSPHSDFLYFTSNRKGGYGAFDLYRARIATRAPAGCETLGPEINGPGDEVGPETWMQGFGLIFSRMPETGVRTCAMYGAMSRRVWRHDDTYSDDEAIRREALAALPRQTLWSHPDAWAGAALTNPVAGGPHFTADDGHAILSVTAPDRTDTDLFLADWDGRSWNRRVPLDGVNTASNEFEGVLSADGRFLYLTSDRDGGSGRSDIWVARRSASNGWDVIEPLGGRVNSAADERGLTLSPDGRMLYFASDRNGTAGGFDVYGATLEMPPETGADAAPTFAVPTIVRVERLAAVSSTEDDVDPALSPDGRLLYFASNRPEGQGGYDLHVSRVIHGVPQNPENAGVELNGAGNERWPALRMQGYDLAYGVGSGSNTPLLVSVTRREIVENIDYARWQSYTALMGRIKWWVLAILGSIVALVYMIRRYRDLTNRFHKCLMASAIIHAAILFLVATWSVTKEVKTSTVAAMEMVVDKVALQDMEKEIGTRKEAMSMDQFKQTASLPSAMVPRKVSEQVREQVNLEAFAPADAGGAAKGGMAVPVAPRSQERSMVEAAPVSTGRRDQPAAVELSRQLKTLGQDLEVASADQMPMEEAPANRPAPAAEIKLDTTRAQKSTSAEFKAGGPIETKAVSATPTGGEIARALPEPGSAAPIKSAGGMASASPAATATRPAQPGESAVLRKPTGYDLPVEGLAMEMPAFGESQPGATNAAGSAKNAGAGHGAFDPAAAVARVGSSFQNWDGLGGGGSGGSRSAGGSGTQGTGFGSPAGSGVGVKDVVGGAGGGGDGSGQGRGGGSSSAVAADGGGRGKGSGRTSLSGTVEGNSTEGVLATIAKHGGVRPGDVRPGGPIEMEAPEEYARRPVADLIVLNGRPSLDMVEALGGSSETEGAIRGSLDWFTRHQEEDGRWSCEKHGGLGDHDVAATALALLCYYGWGMKHNVECEYLKPVKNGLKWLVAQIEADGAIKGVTGQRGMYDQGIAGILLCEAYGISRDPDLLQPASNVVAFIARAQNKDGGWRYQPGAQDSDLSVFGWQFMALHSARMSGITASSNAIEKAGQWLNRVAGGRFGGAYGYQGPGDDSRPAMFACGMFCRQLQKVPPTEDRMKESAGLLRTRPLPGNNVDFYYMYYATLALYQHQGEAWEEWNVRMKSVLPPLQRKTGAEAGSWDPQGQRGGQMGRCVTTALGALSLEVYYRFLPMYGYRSADEEKRKDSEKGSKP